MSTPKPGDKFRVKEQTLRDDFPGVRPIWVQELLDQGVVEFLRHDTGLWLVKGEGFLGDGYWVDPGWLEPLDQPAQSQAPACTCPSLLGGCRCGAMVAEMATRGLVKDRWSGLWVTA